MTLLVSTRRTIRRAIHIEHIRHRGVRFRQHSAKQRAQLTHGRGGTIDPVGLDVSTPTVVVRLEHIRNGEADGSEGNGDKARG